MKSAFKKNEISPDFKIAFQKRAKKIKEISINFSIRDKPIGRLLGDQAGIAQLVEQATENRRVPSSNLGPGTINQAPTRVLF